MLHHVDIKNSQIFDVITMNWHTYLKWQFIP
jgi:hypothetical protein